MKCPACGMDSTRVTNSRLAAEGLAVRRRRECAGCGWRFTTLEERQPAHFLVRKKSGLREPYQRAKLEMGLRKALEKRPIPEDKVRKLIALVEQDISKDARQEVESNEIGRAVLTRLADLDEVAYIRFASVYKEFKTSAGFLREIERLTKVTP